MSLAPLVFLHGWCCDAWHFSDQIPFFAPHREAVSLPWRTLLESHAGAVSLETAVAVVEKECVRHGLHRPVLIGHSMGGMLAAMIAAANRLPLSGVVVVDATWPLHPDAANAYQAMIPELETDFPATLQRLFSTRFVTEHDDPALIRQVAKAAASADPGTAIALLGDLSTPGRLPDGASLSVPVLGIASALELLDREELHRTLPEAWYGQIPGSGHFVTLQAAPQFNEMLSGFLGMLDSLPATERT